MQDSRKHVHSHFYAYLNSHNLLSPVQSGFRKFHSCETSLISLMDGWTNSIEKGLLNGLLFLDLKKSFDLVCHEILIQKLKLYRCNDRTLKWFQSYLTNRTQMTIYKGTRSNSMCISSGVLQGSILGLLLFVAFINDLPSIISSSIELYADDTTITAKGESLNEVEFKLQEGANKVSRWCGENRMAINCIKTKVMLMSTSKRLSLLPSPNLNIKIDDVCLENVSHYTILGVTVDSNLSWQDHSHNVYISICNNLALLKRERHFLPLHTRIAYYNAHILSRVTYCISVWGNSIDLDRLFKLQKRAARIILNITDTRIPTRTLFNKLQWLPIDSLVKMRTLNMVYRSLNHLTSDNLSKVFKYIYSVQTRTRSSKNELLYIPNRVRFKCRRNSFMYLWAVLWNTLPEIIRKSNSLTIFNTLLKKHFSETYHQGAEK